MNKRTQRRAPTLDDVARLAGVNRVTASVALNGPRKGTGTHVSEATRQRVMAAVESLGYTPNALALALRQQRTNVIGYFTGYEGINFYDPFTEAVMSGLRRRCQAHQQDLMLFGSFRARKADQIYAALTGRKVDGVVILPSPTSPIIDKLIESHLPMVAISNDLPQVSSVVVDDRMGAQLLVEHLRQRGHRRVLYIADQGRHVSTVRRRQAFEEFAALFGMTIITAEVNQREAVPSVMNTFYLDVPQAERPTAVACWMDLDAYTVLDWCRLLGLDVPGDLAVVGFDGIPLRVRPAEDLTTICAPWEEVAATAVDLLVASIEGHDVPLETILPVTLHIGCTS